MATGFQQSQTLSLQQVLAPQLQQSLHILQAPLLELQTLVRQELETNPVLEDLPPEQPEDAPADAEIEQLSRLDEEWRDYMAQSSPGINTSQEAQEHHQFLLDSATKGESLAEHLQTQVRESGLTGKEITIAEHIIGNIDDRGFLQSTIEELVNETREPHSLIESVLRTLQDFDPPGIAARDLRECLLIQLRLEGKEKSLESAIVRDHLDELGRKRFADIARKLDVTLEDVRDAACNIGMLDPKPGLRFQPAPERYLVADVLIEKVGDDYVISFNSSHIPHLRISDTYKDLMATAGDATAKEYVREKIRSGKFLIRSIHQRQQTIMAIAAEIVKRQREFLDDGPAHLKPMTMAQVAEVVGIHETTVSRAISAKYVQTPHGLFEMKYFFTTGYQTSDGTAMSNTSVKGAIADLIRNENPSHPLSDQEILETLAERGIPIARRTIAKYRAELGILPSHLRKSA